MSAVRLFLCLLAMIHAGAGIAAPAPLDPQALQHIPVMDVIRLATTRYQVLWVLEPERQRDGVAAIAAMPRPVRTLVWLAVMESDLTDPRSIEPSALVFDGHFKTPMAQALDDAGLTRRAALFRAATAHVVEPEVGKTRPSGFSSPSQVIELGAGFGDKEAFDQALLSYVRDTPVAATWIEAQRGQLGDEDRMRALESGLARSSGYGTAQGMKDWPTPFRTIALADLYSAEVDNGGVHQFFLNSTGDVAPETTAAMTTLGLPKQAETLRKAMAFFPTPYPSDGDRRSRSFDHDGMTDWDNRLNALTSEEDDGTIGPAMIAYAKREGILPR